MPNMIQVEICGIKKKFKSLVCYGHANSGQYGQDIVCASVSAVITGGFNTISNPDGFEMILDEGYALLKAKEEVSNHDEVVIETIITSLKTISQAYPKYVKIKLKKGNNKDDV